MSPEKTSAADRSHGGPGSSHQDARKPQPQADQSPPADTPTNPPRSRVSGGGGERDRRHGHHPAMKK
jgi:hypothetical protein